MLQCCKAAAAVQNPVPETWHQFARLYHETAQPRPAREMALKWLRQLQVRGWHEAAAAAEAVADAAELLVRC